MRDKLVEIMVNVHRECLAEGTYCCYCDYNKYDGRICYKYWMADAIIESGLLKDDKVYKPNNKKDYIDEERDIYNWQIICSKCGYDLTRDCNNYCPHCGAKLKE